MTLKQAIEQAHCRRGKADGTTKDGAYWLVPIGEFDSKIRNWGGDGVGQSAAGHNSYLELRHYRDGAVRARCHHTSWHQNGSWSGGNLSQYVKADSILECTTAEQVIVALKGIRYGEEYPSPVYGDSWEDNVVRLLAKLGIPEAEPAPDEQVAQAS